MHSRLSPAGETAEAHITEQTHTKQGLFGVLPIFKGVKGGWHQKVQEHYITPTK